MTTVYTTTVKKKVEPKTIVTYQGVLIAFCEMHQTFEVNGLPERPTFDESKEDIVKGIARLKEISQIVFGFMVEMIQKGDKVCIYLYVRSNRDGNFQCVETLGEKI